MKKTIIIATIVLVLVVAFFPKKSGGPLCGPICPPDGLHYWERQCLGVVVRDNFIDGYTDRCFGIPVGERKCYGDPAGAPPNTPDVQLSCSYIPN